MVSECISSSFPLLHEVIAMAIHKHATHRRAAPITSVCFIYLILRQWRNPYNYRGGTSAADFSSAVAFAYGDGVGNGAATRAARTKGTIAVMLIMATNVLMWGTV